MRIVLGCLVALVLAVATAEAAEFVLSSPDIAQGATLSSKQVLNGYGCSGGNVSPALEWSAPPAGTKSFALTAYDPDAPTASGWWHWVVFNIPVSAKSLAAGAGTPDGGKLPAGAIQSRTDFGTPGYGGACPPAGDAPHRYVFTLHALDVERLDLKPESSSALVSLMLGKHALGKASITAKYGR